MSQLTTKVLNSGLIPKAVVQLMEIAGSLPLGSSDRVHENAFSDATSEVLKLFATELGDLMETKPLKETHLDLKNFKWPITVTIENSRGEEVANTVAVTDSLGNYFFRYDESKKEWFVPGFTIQKKSLNPVDKDMISESQVLYVGEEPVCYLVTIISDRYIPL